MVTQLNKYRQNTRQKVSKTQDIFKKIKNNTRTFSALFPFVGHKHFEEREEKETPEVSVAALWKLLPGPQPKKTSFLSLLSQAQILLGHRQTT